MAEIQHRVLPRRTGLLVAAGALLVAEVAAAYIIPVPFICRRFAADRRKAELRDLTLDLEVTVPGATPGEAERTLEGRLYLKDPQRLRLELTSEGEEPAVLIERDGKRQHSAGSAELALLPRQDLLTAFFATRGEDSDELAEPMLAALRALRIDPAVVALRRWESGRVVYVAGAKPWEPERPQLWFTKADELPVYYRFNGPGLDGQEHRFEVYLREWGSPVAADWFPAQLELRRDGRTVMAWRVTKAERNLNLPETLFSRLPGR